MGASSLCNELGARAMRIATAFPTETAILDTTAVLSYPTRSATSEQRGALTESGDRCDGNAGIGKSNGFHRDTRPRQGEEFLWRHAWLCLDARGRFAAVFDLNGTKLRISEVADHAPQSHTVLGWEVADIPETARRQRQAPDAGARRPPHARLSPDRR